MIVHVKEISQTVSIHKTNLNKEEIEQRLDKIIETRMTELKTNLNKFKKGFLQNFIQIDDFDKLTDPTTVKQAKDNYNIKFDNNSRKILFTHKYNKKEQLDGKLGEFINKTKIDFSNMDYVSEDTSDNILKIENWQSSPSISITKQQKTLALSLRSYFGNKFCNFAYFKIPLKSSSKLNITIVSNGKEVFLPIVFVGEGIMKKILSSKIDIESYGCNKLCKLFHKQLGEFAFFDNDNVKEQGMESSENEVETGSGWIEKTIGETAQKSSYFGNPLKKRENPFISNNQQTDSLQAYQFDKNPFHSNNDEKGNPFKISSQFQELSNDITKTRDFFFSVYSKTCIHSWKSIQIESFPGQFLKFTRLDFNNTYFNKSIGDLKGDVYMMVMMRKDSSRVIIEKNK